MLPVAIVDLLLGSVWILVAIVVVVLAIVLACVAATFFRKVPQGRALVKTGIGGTKVSFSGMLVVPFAHKPEMMDISVKRIEIDRTGQNGLICKDNMRADIKVAFFVRVNPTEADVRKVAQSIGCDRASDIKAIEALFDAKFSEALKTVGKRFDFSELYEERDTFRNEIIKLIGTDLNGFSLEDAAIDYLEQTPLSSLDPDNILDSEGIKKITELTATQAKLSNNIQRDKERVIKQQDVEAREAILELERQLAETEAKQAREVANVQSREEADTKKVSEENRQRSEQARIAAEEEIQIATQNQERQVIVAMRNKEKTDAVEQERVERERQLEQIERERVTTLKTIEKEKAVEVQRKEIQDVIKERVAVEKTVVIEQEKIKDTEAFAGADREKQVAVTLAEKDAESTLIRKVRDAEADLKAAQFDADEEAYKVTARAEAAKGAADMHAQEVVILAEAEQEAAEKTSAARMKLAEADRAEAAAKGLGAAEVLRATADAESEGIEKKAAAMKLFEEAGQEHEEFKLKLDKQKAVELAEIDVQRLVAAEQSKVVGEALKTAKIDIVGGESEFFDRITKAVTSGKVVDRMVDNSETLSNVRDTFFNGDPEYFKTQVRSWADQFGISSEEMQNLTVSAVLGKMLAGGPDAKQGSAIRGFLAAAERFGFADENAAAALKQLDS